MAGAVDEGDPGVMLVAREIGRDVGENNRPREQGQFSEIAIELSRDC